MTVKFNLVKPTVDPTETDDRGEIAQWAARPEFQPCSIRIKGDFLSLNVDGEHALVMDIAEGQTFEQIFNRIDVLVSHYSGKPPRT